MEEQIVVELNIKEKVTYKLILYAWINYVNVQKLGTLVVRKLRSVIQLQKVKLQFIFGYAKLHSNISLTFKISMDNVQILLSSLKTTSY